jgi:dTMP kinase
LRKGRRFALKDKLEHQRQGLFITFEGVDGSGKSTQANMLIAHLIKKGIEVLATREPGGTRIGGLIRDILLDPALEEMTPMTEALLYAADRAQHVSEVIRPALKRGVIVVSDRYIDSSLAYQGVARSLGLEGVRNLNEWATGELYPDITFLLKVPYEVGLKRLPAGRQDRMEKQNKFFFQEVQEAYLTLSKFFSRRMVVLNGEEKPDVIHHQVMEEVERHL